MLDILQGLEGVVCLIDDILVYKRTQEEYDKHLTAVLQKVAAVGMRGQSVDTQGICADPSKVKAIQQMLEPKIFLNYADF